MNSNIVDLNDLENNPTPRVPVCLCLDTSGSMGRIVRGEVQDTGKTIYKDGQTWNVVTGGVSAIDDLTEGINQFFEAIRSDEVAIYSAEICVITFGGTKAELISPFETVDQKEESFSLIYVTEVVCYRLSLKRETIQAVLLILRLLQKQRA